MAYVKPFQKISIIKNNIICFANHCTNKVKMSRNILILAVGPIGYARYFSRSDVNVITMLILKLCCHLLEKKP